MCRCPCPVPVQGRQQAWPQDPCVEVVQEATPEIGTVPWRGRVPRAHRRSLSPPAHHKAALRPPLSPGDGP